MTHSLYLFAHIFLFAMSLTSKFINIFAFRKLPNSALLRRPFHSNAWISHVRHSPISISSVNSVPSTVKLPFRSHLRSFSDGKRKEKYVGVFQHLPEFFNLVHLKNFTKAKEIYDFIQASHSGPSRHKKNLLTAMLSLCEKGDQLEFAQQIRNQLRTAGYIPTESDIFPLIKCACDLGDISLAKQYLQDITDAKFIVRHRDIFPILKAITATNSINSSHELMAECFLLRNYGLYPRLQELELIIASGVRTGAIKDPVFRDQLSDFISLMNDTYCAIDQASALRIHQAVHEGTLATEEGESINFLTQIFRKGILVGKHRDITGKLLKRDPILPSGQFVAERASFIGHSEEELQRLRNESQVLLERQTGKKKKPKLSRDRLFRPEPDTVTRLWTQVPELGVVAKQHDIAEDRLDLYEVLSTPNTPIGSASASRVDADTPTDTHAMPFPSFATPLFTHTHVGRDGIRNLLRNRHCAVSAICPHTHANLSIIPPSNIQYFLPEPKSRGSGEETFSGDHRNSDPSHAPPPSSSSSCRLVEVSQDTAACPNCGDILKPILMNAEDIEHVKSVLTTLTTSASKVAGEKLQRFDKWLAERDDFDFVIDAANVAYYNQNFKGGKFSFQQVELMYDALKRSQVTANPRVLVLIPEGYMQRKRHNAVTPRRGTVTSTDDYRIISRFKEENSVYTVPRHIDDDWFVIYATLCGKRNSTIGERRTSGEAWRPTYAVSNDLCRDHKLSFLSPRPFFRWRSSQVVFFDFSYSLHEQNSKQLQNVSLSFPGAVSREFQQSTSNSSRWHLPIDDRQSWLCLNI